MTFSDFLKEAAEPKMSPEQAKAAFAKFDTEDYQRRDGSYPQSGVPDSVHAGAYEGEVWLEFMFKNTSEKAAKAWAKKFMDSKKLPYTSIESSQDGDYHDDWVSVEAKYIA